MSNGLNRDALERMWGTTFTGTTDVSRWQNPPTNPNYWKGKRGHIVTRRCGMCAEPYDDVCYGFNGKLHGNNPPYGNRIQGETFAGTIAWELSRAERINACKRTEDAE